MIDTTKVMIRARVRKHLDALIARFAELLASAKVQVDAGTDYRYRIIVGKKVWTAIASELADEIDYGNFKGAVQDHEYHQAMMSVWDRMNRMQTEEEKLK